MIGLKGISFLLLLLFIGDVALSQDFNRYVRGKVRDKISYQPVPGANVVIRNTSESKTIGAVTNEDGSFEIGPLDLGRYSIVVSHIGYQDFVIPELLVKASRDIFLNVNLNIGATVLDEVVVDAAIPDVHINMLGKQPITVEQTLRYAATFNDPARLSTTFPGVSTINDQNNNIVVRGNSPNGVGWRLQGVDIVNPNHLTNAGTFTDRPVQSGGSVNILSSQLLGNSTFLNGAFDATYGNALSGVFDMNLREGDRQDLKFTTQASLLGLDFAVEGPLSGSRTTTFIANYRYSTIGLLNTLGIDLGDEAITFQDISFHISTTTPNGANWTFFGIGGTSRNEFIANRDSSIWKFEKDRQDILYEGKMMGLGISSRYPLSAKSYIFNSIAFSVLENERTASILDQFLTPSIIAIDSSKNQIFSWRSEFLLKPLNNISISTGFHINHHLDELVSGSASFGRFVTSGEGSSILFQPFFNITQILGKSFSFNLGFRHVYHQLSQSHSFEPRLGIKLNTSAKSDVYFRYGKHSLLQRPGILYYSYQGIDGNEINPNKDLGLSKADHVVIGVDVFPTEQVRINAELYYQSLYNIPVSKDSSNSFSVLNQMEGFVTEILTNNGSGKNYGFDLSIRRTFSNNFYYQANTSIYESKYEGSNGIERDSRFNGNYAFNFTGGQEFIKSGTTTEKTFGVNLNFVYLGGFRDTPIDESSSEIEGRTVYFTEESFSIKMRDYTRLDLRLSWTKNKLVYTRTISIDIQNLTNRQNIAYSYYDTQIKGIVEQNQLGIIPILAYRVEF